MIFKDFKFYKTHTPSKSTLAVCINPNFHVLVLYRIAHMLQKKRLGMLSKLIWFYYRVVYSMDIDWRADIGKNVMFVHGIGTVIGSGVSISDNCFIYQNVTLGGSGKSKVHKEKDIYFPIIESGCRIYAGAQIIGPVVIGENSIIGAGTAIFRDIPPNSLVREEKKIRIKNIE